MIDGRQVNINVVLLLMITGGSEMAGGKGGRWTRWEREGKSRVHACV